MKEELEEFGLYVWLIIKKLILWLSGVFVVLEVINRVHSLKIRFPAYLFWLIGCVGLIWAGFRIYKEQLKSVPLGKELIKVRRAPKISLVLVEGNQFSYLLPDWAVTDMMRKLPRGTVKLHLKALNDGYSDVEVLSITGNAAYHDLLYVDSQDGVFNNEMRPIQFPFTLRAHDKWLGDLVFPIKPMATLNEAQIRDRLSKPQADLRLSVWLEFHDASNKTRRVALHKSISPESLVEMYKKRLDEYEELRNRRA